MTAADLESAGAWPETHCPALCRVVYWVTEEE